MDAAKRGFYLNGTVDWEEELKLHTEWLDTESKKGRQLDCTEVYLGHYDCKGKCFDQAILKRSIFGNANVEASSFRGADLQEVDLTKVYGLHTSSLGGANLAGAVLPPNMDYVDGLSRVEELSKTTGKTFLTIIIICIFSLLAILRTQDVQILTYSGTTKLPFIDAEIPVSLVYTVMPLVLCSLYFYLHLNMQRLWEALANLPAVFPNGQHIHEKSYPWLLNELVQHHFLYLNKVPKNFAWSQRFLSIFLAWYLIPLSLLPYWSRYLVQRDWMATTRHILILTGTLWLANVMFKRCWQTLSVGSGRKIPVSVHGFALPRYSSMKSHDKPDSRGRRFGRSLLLSGPLALVLGIISWLTFEGTREYSFGMQYPSSTYSRVQMFAPHAFETLLGEAIYHPFANLSEMDTPIKPANWPLSKQEDLKNFKGLSLTSKDLRYARAAGAFFVNADLRSINFEGADLNGAYLNAAKLDFANLNRAQMTTAHLDYAALAKTQIMFADCSRATFINASLVGANCRKTKFEGTIMQDVRITNSNLEGCTFTGADLSRVIFKNVDLTKATFRDATLIRANFDSQTRLDGVEFIGTIMPDVQFEEGRDLTKTVFTSAVMNRAHLSKTTLDESHFDMAFLSGANLSRASLIKADFGACDLRGANLQGANLTQAYFGVADLRDADLTGAKIQDTGLVGAKYNSKTRWPKDFSIASHPELDLVDGAK